MDAVSNLYKGNATYCSPFATQGTCSNWLTGLSTDKNTCFNPIQAPGGSNPSGPTENTPCNLESPWVNGGIYNNLKTN
jgi:hypothetical protein